MHNLNSHACCLYLARSETARPNTRVVPRLGWQLVRSARVNDVMRAGTAAVNNMLTGASPLELQCWLCWWFETRTAKGEYRETAPTWRKDIPT